MDGAWLDMNDPATGESSSDEMLFEHGQTPHARFHNQYAHFMCAASRAAFERLDPQRRPFLLTRSASTGTQRHAAVWTGDNASNWPHLRMTIPCTLNLGLSGVAFNGPDVGGFMGNADAELLTRWYQAGFLFPFFRNHSCEGTKAQEPWEFGPVVRGRIADVIRTRYRLLPHVYQLFWEHHLHGDPILRPMGYEFDDPGLEHVDDQFLLGPSLLAAPMLHSLEENHALLVHGQPAQFRAVTLPAGCGWFDLNRGEWLAGGQTLRYPVGLDESPLFVRDGSILFWHGGELANGHTDFRAAVELHVFCRDGAATGRYHLDDQTTRAYLLDGAAQPRRLPRRPPPGRWVLPGNGGNRSAAHRRDDLDARVLRPRGPGRGRKPARQRRTARDGPRPGHAPVGREGRARPGVTSAPDDRP